VSASKKPYGTDKSVYPKCSTTSQRDILNKFTPNLPPKIGHSAVYLKTRMTGNPANIDVKKGSICASLFVMKECWSFTGVFTKKHLVLPLKLSKIHQNRAIVSAKVGVDRIC
jgi:hypothetical protein